MNRPSTRRLTTSPNSGRDRRPEDIARDVEQLKALRDANFTGDAWREFAENLFIRGGRVLRRWVRRGDIMRKTRPVRPLLGQRPQSEVTRLILKDEREDLVMETLTRAVAAYRDRLREGKWRPDGGASLWTYFIGQCGIQWQIVYSQRAAQINNERPLDVSGEFRRGDVESWGQANDDLLDVIDVKIALSHADSTTAQTVVLNALHGFRHKEIAAKLGITSRAVEGRIYRFRQDLEDRGIA